MSLLGCERSGLQVLSLRAQAGKKESKHERLTQAIRETGLSETAIRHYESRGLIQAPRGQRGTVLVTKRVVEELHILAAARNLGFSVEESGLLLEIRRSEGGLTDLAVSQLDALNEKKRDLMWLFKIFSDHMGNNKGASFAD